MVWLWILGILFLLLALICVTRVGATVHLDQRITFTIRAGLLRIRLDPFGPKKPKKKKPPKKKQSAKEITAKDLKSRLPKPTREDILDAWHTLWPAVRKALSRTRRSIRIQPLELAVCLAGEDPADTAQLYGYLSAALWTVMPVLEKLLVIPDPRIQLGLDLDKQVTEVRGRIGLSFRIGDLLRIGLAAGIPALRWFLRFRKRHKNGQAAAEKAGQAA